MVNDAVFLLDGNREDLRHTIGDEMTVAFPQVGFDITGKEENAAYELRYGDARGDQ